MQVLFKAYPEAEAGEAPRRLILSRFKRIIGLRGIIYHTSLFVAK